MMEGDTDSIALGGSAVSMESLQKLQLVRKRHDILPDYNDHDDNQLITSENDSEITQPYERVKHKPHNKASRNHANLMPDEIETEDVVGQNVESDQRDDDSGIEMIISDTDIKTLDSYKKRVLENDQTVLYDMFKLLITKMCSISNEVRNIKMSQNKLNKRVIKVEQAIDYYGGCLDKNSAEIAEIADMSVKLTQAAIKLDQMVSHVTNKLSQVEKNYSKGCFTITGMLTAEDSSPKDEAFNFLKNIMKIDPIPEIISTHCMGKTESSPMWLDCSIPMKAG